VPAFYQIDRTHKVMLAAIALIFVGRVVCLLNASYCASHMDLNSLSLGVSLQ
jgi:hypothetical protein